MITNNFFKGPLAQPYEALHGIARPEVASADLTYLTAVIGISYDDNCWYLNVFNESYTEFTYDSGTLKSDSLYRASVFCPQPEGPSKIVLFRGTATR
jgi:hypothetical protein